MSYIRIYDWYTGSWHLFLVREWHVDWEKVVSDPGTIKPPWPRLVS